jgi:hypothetical protein
VILPANATKDNRLRIGTSEKPSHKGAKVTKNNVLNIFLCAFVAKLLFSIGPIFLTGKSTRGQYPTLRLELAMFGKKGGAVACQAVVCRAVFGGRARLRGTAPLRRGSLRPPKSGEQRLELGP